MDSSQAQSSDTVASAKTRSRKSAFFTTHEADVSRSLKMA